MNSEEPFDMIGEKRVGLSWLIARTRRRLNLLKGGAAAEKERIDDQAREALTVERQKFRQRLQDLFAERDRARQEAFFLKLEKHRGESLEAWREVFFRELKVYEVDLFAESLKGIHLDLHQELPSDWL